MNSENINNTSDLAPVDDAGTQAPVISPETQDPTETRFAAIESRLDAIEARNSEKDAEPEYDEENQSPNAVIV